MFSQLRHTPRHLLFHSGKAIPPFFPPLLLGLHPFISSLPTDQCQTQKASRMPFISPERRFNPPKPVGFCASDFDLKSDGIGKNRSGERDRDRDRERNKRVKL